ncbi:AAA family ATPase [Deltaproteobacteria bacterium TL4]
MSPGIKNIAYGVSDFERIQSEKHYFVDKTRFIPLLEENPFIFFIRPRRFGKSLWVSILETYYDLAKKEQFETFFQGTWIGEHPTQEHNAYLVLTFNFSAVIADVQKVEQSFEEYGNQVLEFFAHKYASLLGELTLAQMKQSSTFASRLSALLTGIRETQCSLYILIDEYDNFANTILSTAGNHAYHDLTHGEGFFRHFFTVLKSGTSQSGSGLKRLFITGVSPITMDDVTSGFNIGSNLSLDERLNEMVGFTEAEVRLMLEYYQSHGLFQQEIEETLHLFREWYNGYRFGAPDQPTVFNTDMVLYFVQKSIQVGHPPRDLIDPNIRIDYGKLRHLLLVNRQLNGNFDQLKLILAERQTVSPLPISFPLERLNQPDNFTALLYYFGLLGIESSEHGRFHMKVPNLTVWHLMYSYLREAYLDTGTFRAEFWKLDPLLQDMAWQGTWEPFFDYLAKAIQQQTSVRDYLEGEKVIQGFLLAYLHLCDFFLVRPEQELNKGFSDLFLEPFTAKYPDMPWGYLIELKYFKRGKLSKTQVQKTVCEAEQQLKKYLQDERLAHYGQHVRFKGLVLVYHGWELVHRSAVGE